MSRESHGPLPRTVIVSGFPSQEHTFHGRADLVRSPQNGCLEVIYQKGQRRDGGRV